MQTDFCSIISISLSMNIKPIRHVVIKCGTAPMQPLCSRFGLVPKCFAWRQTAEVVSLSVRAQRRFSTQLKQYFTGWAAKLSPRALSGWHAPVEYLNFMPPSEHTVSGFVTNSPWGRDDNEAAQNTSSHLMCAIEKKTFLKPKQLGLKLGDSALCCARAEVSCRESLE